MSEFSISSFAWPTRSTVLALRPGIYLPAPQCFPLPDRVLLTGCTLPQFGQKNIGQIAPKYRATSNPSGSAAGKASPVEGMQNAAHWNPVKGGSVCVSGLACGESGIRFSPFSANGGEN